MIASRDTDMVCSGLIRAKETAPLNPPLSTYLAMAPIVAQGADGLAVLSVRVPWSRVCC